MLSKTLLLFFVVSQMVDISHAQQRRSLTLPYQQVESYKWLEQGWTKNERDNWHYLSAGQTFAPLAWIISLERQGKNQKLMGRQFMESIGFLYDEKNKNNPDNLPIGFAVSRHNPHVNGKVGFTCAACHTTQINYKGNAVRISGGSSLLDLATFFVEYQMALEETYKNSKKWEKFSLNVRKQTKDSDEELRNQVKKALKSNHWASKELIDVYKNSIAGWPGRLDALNGIGNLLFATTLKVNSNFHALSAPASIPFLWDIWKFDWMHYNSSFSQPMAQNVLQVLGANGWTNFIDSDGKPNAEPLKWDSSVDIKALESTDVAFRKLKAPIWPIDLLGAIDTLKAVKGQKLFDELCASCHSPKANPYPLSEKAKFTITNIPIHIIGTDPVYAEKFASQTFDISKLSGNHKRVGGSEALTYVTERIKNRSYDLLDYSESQRKIANGFGRDNIMKGDLVYRARTLNGVWSSAPYLHNGSVPNMYELLSPVAERSSKFWLGTYEYDPKLLGFVSSEIKNGFLFDTSIPGNSNKGHEFNNSPGPGVIGRGLSHIERIELIEYLKSMN